MSRSSNATRHLQRLQRRPRAGVAIFGIVQNRYFNVVLSPCVGICDLREDGLCRGCLRNVGEIASRASMDDAQRVRVMEELPLREVLAAGKGG